MLNANSDSHAEAEPISFGKPRPLEKEKFHSVYGCKLKGGFDSYFVAKVSFQSKVAVAASNQM